ncbi:NAD(P)/FAD-dependent oxidoreductase [Campylobacter lari]|uniref:phytoene desaturase family protein n=1 Tax=Campylobacter lari TaxID=201 RepID=UPI00127695A5|nr:NAD(P)/FAD-dependent oxidoreductase [Campylobacter lari]EAJ5675305.1 NAD(P)/FAD-dependent oxidoreductase [Campylobacter lari]EAK0767221.1 NAD(P)/FAD-dependent oxidoreductase [Campylobacter lari]EAK5584013.1 NAD(P)/FAD-dependent oxidoreductase [Campylobacter lari]EAK5585403.1 NAD(P)/FAD-dependent oxidoreductase [Campylobacter lari]
MDVKFDVIIIGSGLGGLSAGAFLARNGKKVLVLEQHSLIGGCATCFKRKGILIDAGLHEMDFGDPKTDMKHLIFEKLGINNKIEILPLPSAWSIKSKNYNLTLSHGIEKVKEVLKKEFPQECKGIDKYFNAIRLQAYSVRRFPWDMSFMELFLFPFTTAWIFLKNKITNKKVYDVLNSYIKSDKLKKILNANLSYYHHDSKEFIFSFHGIAQKHYYDGGVYIKGGSQALSNALAAVIKENQGHVLAKAEVVKILTKDQKVYGVEYIQNNQKHTIHAQNIIANCDPLIVYKDLLKDLNLIQEIKAIESKKRACSLVSAYFIYDEDISKIYENIDYCNFIFEDDFLNSSYENTNILKLDIKKRPMAFVNYSKIDSGLASDKYIGVVAFSSKYSEWDLNKQDYQAKKEEVLKAIVQRLDEIFPNLSSYLIHQELATPKTIQKYTKAYEGTIYGFSQDQEGAKYRLHYKSKSIENLYYANAFIFPGGGFTGAILGGYFCANKMNFH